MSLNYDQFLKDNQLFPIEKQWEKLKVNLKHGEKSISKKEISKLLKEELGDKNGLYLYKKNENHFMLEKLNL